MYIGDGLRRLRSELNMTQTELANATGVSLVTINRWEKGRTLPSKIVSEAFLHNLEALQASPSSLQYLRDAFAGVQQAEENKLRKVDIAMADTIIDKADMAIVVYDLETRELLYLNKKAKSYAYDGQIITKGMTCHDYFLGNPQICEQCPVNCGNLDVYSQNILEKTNGRKILRTAQEVMWQGRKAHIVYVSEVKEFTGEDNGQMSEREKALIRMKKAFEKSINVYTEIDLHTMEYSQINLQNSENYVASAQGNYTEAFEVMCIQEIDPKDVPLVRQKLSPAALKAVAEDPQGPDEIVVRYHLKNKDASNHMQSHVFLLRDHKELYAISIVTDVTKQLELLEEKEVLKRILANVTAGVFVGRFSSEGFKTITTNQAMKDLLGINKELPGEITNDFMSQYLYAADVEKYHDFIEGFRVPNHIDSIEYQLMNKDTGKIKWISVTGRSMLRHDNQNIVYLSHTDITDLKEQQQILLYNQKAVEQAEKYGNLSIWTFNIDKKTIIQQGTIDADSHMGYAHYIQNVPDCFIESNSVYPDDIGVFLDCYQKLQEGVAKTEAVYRLMNQKTGQFTWVRMFYQIMDQNSEDRMAVGFSYDADVQQEAIAQYQTERDLRKKVHTDALVYIEYNLTKREYVEKSSLNFGQGNISWETLDIQGYKDALSATVEDCFVESMAETLYEDNLLKSYKAGLPRVEFEYRTKSIDGYPIKWLKTTANMVQRPDNGDIMAFIYIEDIDDKKKKQLAIECSMADGVESITLIHASDGKAKRITVSSGVDLNAPAVSFDYNDTFIQRASKVIVPEEREAIMSIAGIHNVLQELEHQEVYQFSASLILTDGTFKRELFRYRYLDDRKTDIVLTISNVTEVYLENEKKTEQLQEAKKQAEAANRATTQFLSRMSHDMRTPMNGILGMAKLSQNENDVAVLKNNIQKMEESGQYLLGLINDTLDFQRIQSGRMKLEPKIVYTKEIIDNIINMVSVTAKEKNVELRLEPNIDLDWYINIDTMRIKQILMNLLSNAIKFTPSGGIVEFKMDLIAREGMISHDLLTIRDSGCGMSEEFLANGIFKPFSQETNATTGLYAGSGLGLSIAKNLVELMGGTIEVESELGVGTTFRIYLDFERVDSRLVEHNKKLEETNNQQLELILHGKHILLAEDHPLNAMIATKLLEQKGCNVVWAKDGVECVKMFATSGDSAFDAILMDVRMPRMTGIEATKKIRSLTGEYAKTIPIIAMTANAFEDDRRETHEAGMTAHLAKPVQPEALYQCLNTCITHNQQENK